MFNLLQVKILLVFKQEAQLLPRDRTSASLELK